ncbi:MAG: hypothetical protein ACI4IU_07235 [Candidatus Limousia pullorum]
MEVIIVVPLIAVLYFLVCSILLAKVFLENIGNIISYVFTFLIIFIIVMMIIFLIIDLSGREDKKGKKSVPVIITGIVLIISFVYSLVLFGEMVSIDESNYLMNLFGWNVDVRMLLLVITYLSGGILILSISSAFESRILNFLFLIFEVCFLIWFPLYCSSVAAQSYSDYQCKNAEIYSDNLVEYEVVEDAEIYCPSAVTLSPNIYRMYPILGFDKYTYGYFEAGETVLVIGYSNYADRAGSNYYRVTNGEKAGFVESDKLQKKETVEYSYYFEISETADVYEHLEVEKPNKYNEYETHLEDEVGENIIAKLEKGVEVKKIDKEDDYWLIQTENGIEGYVELKYIDLIREKIS